MNRHAKLILISIAGWGFVLLGIVGLFLPILQGVLFILIGLIILSTEYAWAHHWLTRLRQRFPKLGRIADEAMQKARIWVRRLTGQPPAD